MIDISSAKMKITDTLILEHAVMGKLFDSIERELSGVRTATGAKLLARLLQSLLEEHADAEVNLVYVALDHTLAERGMLDRLYQEHEELDARLQGVQKESNAEAARDLLRAAIAATRAHFEEEERKVFPFIEQVLGSEVLEELNEARCAKGMVGQPANELQMA